MKKNLKTAFCRIARDETGQILTWTAVLLTMLYCGLGALVIDVGRAVVAQHLLQASADAAAMAGAQAMGASLTPSQSSIYTQACTFGGQAASSGNCTIAGKNASTAFLPSATMASGYPVSYCSTTISNTGVPCVTISGGGGATGNTLKVAESLTLPMWFGAIIGIPNIQMTAGAMAAMRGSPRNPYNVAIIIDTTDSMNSTDGKTSNCSSTRIACSLQGALTLLGDLSPCSAGGSCGSVVTGTTNVSNPVDEVAIYTFPGLTSTTNATNDADCGATMKKAGSTGATVSYYNTTTAPTYQVVGFSSNYASKDPTTQTSSGATNPNLQTSSLLVDASAGKSGCGGLQAVGGAGTYYAQVITQAQSDLVAQQSARLNGTPSQQTQNVMIILSDGDATSTYSQLGNYNESLTSPYYQSIFNECEQAVKAAQAATTAGTTVYTVAYGTQSSGCASDQSGFSVTISGTKYTNTSPSKLTPCEAMQQMASNSTTFYSDYNAGGNGGSNDTSCQGASGSDTSLNDIFSFISSNLSEPRLIPWGTS